MGFARYTTLALLALRAVSVLAADPVAAAAADPVEEGTAVPTVVPNLHVRVSASFPSSEVFGVKLVNGHATQAALDFTNEETEPVTVSMVGGSLSSIKLLPGKEAVTTIIKNLTTTRYDVEIPAGGKETLPFVFTADLHPQELRLNILAVVLSKAGAIYQIPVYNETVSAVEAPTSFFDPQIIFLYLFLLAAAGATLTFVYNTWIATLFPQKKRGGLGGERAKKSSGGSKKAVSVDDQAAVIGADGPAVTTGAKFDESWIPETHLNRPKAKRVVSSASKKKGGMTSGSERD